MSSDLLKTLEQDLVELNKILEHAARKRSQDVISGEILKVNAELSDEKAKLQKKAAEGDSIETKPVEEKNVHFITITKYAWDQESENVKIYLTLEEIGKVEKANITFNMTESSIDLQILGYKNQNHRFGVRQLAGKIDTTKSKFTQKQNTIIINLKKEKARSWDNLEHKEQEKPKKGGPGGMGGMGGMGGGGMGGMGGGGGMGDLASMMGGMGGGMGGMGGGGGKGGMDMAAMMKMMGGMGGMGGGMGGMGGGMGGMGGMGGGMGGMGGMGDEGEGEGDEGEGEGDEGEGEEGAGPGGAGGKDPNASLMNMMKNLYETGDDNMKKTISEAMTKAQDGKKP